MNVDTVLGSLPHTRLWSPREGGSPHRRVISTHDFWYRPTLQTLRISGVHWAAVSEALEQERNGIGSPFPKPVGSLPVAKDVGFREGVAPLDLLERLGTEPKVLGRLQARSRRAPGRLEWVNAGPKRGQGFSNQRVKARSPAPARGLATPGGVARGRARVCRSCRWAGPGRGAGGARSGAGPAPRAPPGGLRAAPVSRAGGFCSEEPAPDPGATSK